jgi:hypothetical protein
MIRELLEQRNSEYENFTQHIIGLYADKLTKALRFYMKTERDIYIDAVEFYPTNKNFVLSYFSAQLKVGDRLQIPDGSIIVLDESNVHSYKSDQLKMVLPIKVLEESSATEIYELLKKYDNFIKSFGETAFQKCLTAGINELEEIVYNSKYVDLLDSLTDPIDDILASKDDLQKVQYMIFSKDTNRVIN